MQEEHIVYTSGTLPIPTTYWRVERVYRATFRTIGYIRVTGRMVRQEMDAAQSIVHHEAIDIARRIAHRRFPDIALIVIRVERQGKRWVEY